LEEINLSLEKEIERARKKEVLELSEEVPEIRKTPPQFFEHSYEEKTEDLLKEKILGSPTLGDLSATIPEVGTLNSEKYLTHSKN